MTGPFFPCSAGCRAFFVPFFAMGRANKTWEPEERCYTVPELAALWQVNADELRKRCARGLFSRAWKVGNEWRIPAGDANAYRQARAPFSPAEGARA